MKMWKRTAARRSIRSLQRFVATIALATTVGGIATAVTPTPAQAWWWSPRVVVIGHACPGGYINAMMWNTDKENGTQYANGSDFSIDLKQVNSWGTGLHLSIQCNNNTWYGFYRWIDRPGNSVYVDLGWI